MDGYFLDAPRVNHLQGLAGDGDVVVIGAVDHEIVRPPARPVHDEGVGRCGKFAGGDAGKRQAQVHRVAVGIWQFENGLQIHVAAAHRGFGLELQPGFADLDHLLHVADFERRVLRDGLRRADGELCGDEGAKPGQLDRQFVAARIDGVKTVQARSICFGGSGGVGSKPRQLDRRAGDGCS